MFYFRNLWDQPLPQPYEARPTKQSWNQPREWSLIWVASSECVACSVLSYASAQASKIAKSIANYSLPTQKLINNDHFLHKHLKWIMTGCSLGYPGSVRWQHLSPSTPPAVVTAKAALPQIRVETLIGSQAEFEIN